MPREYGWRDCRECGKEYHVNSLHQKWCSAKCYMRHYEKGRVFNSLGEVAWVAVYEVVEILKGSDVPLTRKGIGEALRKHFGTWYPPATIAIIVHYARQKGYAIDSWKSGGNGRYAFYAMAVPTC